MKCTIPEISWHNRDPVLSVDIQPSKDNSEGPYRLASGGTDSHVVIWYVHKRESGLVEIEFASDLQRHQRAVNVVRFSPSGEFLASGDDESVIIIWKQKTDLDAPELPSSETEGNREYWLTLRTLRGHLEDVYDVSWSMDSSSLISGSVDNSAIIWDVQKGKAVKLLKEHTGFVQGVAWDPKNYFVATMCSDRMCRIYSLSSKRVLHNVSKAVLPVSDGSELEGKTVRLFHDDTLKSFFRRLCFSPDGELLIVPSGFVEIPNTEKHFNATYIFTRSSLNRPVLYFPSPDQYTIAVRCCPILFQLHEGDSVFALPYRIVIAVATQSCVMLYDTQQAEPFALISNIHYTRLTDLTWSADGHILVVSSTDGYCSVIRFGPDELGTVYEENQIGIGAECDHFTEAHNYTENNEAADKEKMKTRIELTSNSGTIDPSVQSSPQSQANTMPDSVSPVKNSCSALCDDNKQTKCSDKTEKSNLQVNPVKKHIGSQNNSASLSESESGNISGVVKNGEATKETKSVSMEVESFASEFTERDGIVSGQQTCIMTLDNTKKDSDCIKSLDENSGKDSCNSTGKTGSIENVCSDTSLRVSETSVTEKPSTPGSKKSAGVLEEFDLKPAAQDSPPSSASCTEPNRRTPRRVQLITIASPKSKKKLIQ